MENFIVLLYCGLALTIISTFFSFLFSHSFFFLLFSIRKQLGVKTELNVLIQMNIWNAFCMYSCHFIFENQTRCAREL